jgi:uncharacterized delta-60 repeat protein
MESNCLRKQRATAGLLLVCIAALFGAKPSWAQSVVENSFNPQFNGFISTIAVQSDGKVLAGGNFTSVNSSAHSFLVRLNADGSVDSTFAPASAPAQFVSSVQIAGSKIYVAAGDGLRRFNANGTLDWIYPMSIRAFGVDSQERIVFGGQFTRIENQSHRNIARLEANGLLDATFAPTVGCCVGEGVQALVTQGDAAIIGGAFQSVNGTVAAHFAKINSDGSADAGFQGAADPPVLTLATTADGKILRASQQTVSRHLSDGALDPSFASVFAGGSSDDRFVALAVQPDGKALVGGSFALNGSATRSYIVRLNSNGSVDSSFAIQPNDAVQAIAVHSDGSAFIAGNFTEVNGTPRTGLARIVAARPILNIAAAGGGKVVLSWPAGLINARLESCALNDTSWAPLAGAPVTANGAAYVTNSATANGRLYRLRVQ